MANPSELNDDDEELEIIFNASYADVFPLDNESFGPVRRSGAGPKSSSELLSSIVSDSF
jgi:hypothetical protein